MNDLSERRELSRAAHELLADKVFQTAVEKAKQRRLDELMLETTTSPERKLELISEMRAIEAIAQELKSIDDDSKMLRARHA